MSGNIKYSVKSKERKAQKLNKNMYTKQMTHTWKTPLLSWDQDQLELKVQNMILLKVALPVLFN